MRYICMAKYSYPPYVTRLVNVYTYVTYMNKDNIDNKGI